MGKFNKGKGAKNRNKELEIVPKAAETEIQLPVSRKSDDVIPKKVRKVFLNLISCSHFFRCCFSGKMDKSSACVDALWPWNQFSRSPFNEGSKNNHASSSCGT